MVAVVAVVTAVVQGPSLAEVARHAGRQHPALLSATLLAATAAAVALLLAAPRRWPATARRLASVPVTVGLGVVLVAVAVVARRYEVHLYASGRGGSQALALIEPAKALLHGRALYDVTLPGGRAADPVSPGPAWLVVNAPLVWVGAGALVVPLWLLAATAAARVCGARYWANASLALLLCSPHLTKELTEGEDTAAVMAAMVVVVLLADRWAAGGHPPVGVVSGRQGVWRAAAVGVLAGVVATGRLIYLPAPLLVAVLVWRRDRVAAAVIGVTGTAVAVAANVAASIGQDPYPPAHVFARASAAEPVAVVVAGAVATTVAGLGVLHARPGHTAGRLGWLAACLGIPHAFIAVGELAGRRWALDGWEGANYLFAAAPLVLAAAGAAAAARWWPRATLTPDPSGEGTSVANRWHTVP